MDIHIDCRGVNFEIQEELRSILCRNHTLVSLQHCTAEIGMIHISPIDKEELLRIATSRLWSANIARNLDKHSINININKLLRNITHLATTKSNDALFERGNRQIVNQILATIELESDIGMSEYDARHLLQNVAHFSFIAFEKLTTSRHIEKEILNQKLSANSTLLYLLTHNLRAFDFDKSAQFIAISARAEFDLCHRSNRCQSLASKAHSGESK